MGIKFSEKKTCCLYFQGRRRSYPFTKLHDVSSQKTAILTFVDMRNSRLRYRKCFTMCIDFTFFDKYILLHLKSNNTFLLTGTSVAGLPTYEHAYLSSASVSDLYSNNKATRRIISAPLTQNVCFINRLSGELFTNYCTTVAAAWDEGEGIRYHPRNSAKQWVRSWRNLPGHIKRRGIFTPHTGKPYHSTGALFFSL